MNEDVVSRATAALAQSVALIIGDDDYDDATKAYELAETFTEFQDYLERNGAVDVEKAGGSAHDSAGRLIQHLTDALDAKRERHGFEKRKESPPMDTTTELIKIMKDGGGPVVLCKSIVDRGSAPCTEVELTAAISKAAAAASGEREDVAFAKLFEREESVRRAINIAKAMPFVADLTPVMVGGADARDLSDESEAIAQLKQIGRDRWPTASEAQQFARALTDPKNAVLAAKAHHRPAATTNYPFPR
jgi:hypothetical protein